MARREKSVGGDNTLTLMLLAGAGVVGVVLVVVFAGLKKSNPIIEAGGDVPDYIVAAPPPEDISVETSNLIKTNDPVFKSFQIWRRAREVARDDLEKAIRMCEGTIQDIPEYAGDAYFYCVQCIEYHLEPKLYGNRHKAKHEMPLTKSQAKAYFDREFSYYNKALAEYQKPGAKTLLGITKTPEEQIRKLRENMKAKQEKIIPWWMDHLPE